MTLALVHNLRCCIWHLGYIQLVVYKFSKLREHEKFPQDEYVRDEKQIFRFVSHIILNSLCTNYKKKGEPEVYCKVQKNHVA